MAPDQSEGWLTEKVAWLKTSMKDHHEIWKVPLLATLTTYRAAHGASSPPHAASLLHDVIQDSVNKWEYHRKSAPPGGNDQALRPQMLIAGFSAIGHALNTRGDLSANEAEEIVMNEISRWGMSEPITRELSRQILWFWDNSVGIFVDVNGRIQARSRQFAELGDAYWASEKGRRSSWLATALTNPSKREAVQIAAITNANIVHDLLNHAENNLNARARSRALSWISDFSRDNSVSLDVASTERLLELLGNAGKEGLQFDNEDERSGSLKELFDSLHDVQNKADGKGWVFTYHLATFPTAPPIRAHRDSIIETLHFDDERLRLVEALVALSDSDFDGQAPLTESTVEKIREILQIPIPPQPLPRKIPGQPLAIYPSTFNPPTGTADVAAGAAARIELFPKEMVSTLYALAKALPHGQSKAITKALRSAGHTDPEPLEFNSMFLDSLREKSELGGWGWLVGPAASLSYEHSPDDTVDRWRWRALADLVDALDYRNASIPGFRHAAKEDPQVILQWIDAISAAGSITKAAIGTQARSLLKITEQDEIEGIIDLIEEPRLEQILLQPQRLSHEQSLAAVPALLSDSDWLSLSAAALLVNQNHPPLADMIRSNTKKLKQNAQCFSSLVRCTNSSHPSADIRDLLATEDPSQRTAAAYYLGQFHASELGQYWEAAMIDDDLSVRYAAGATEVVDPQPHYWSCRWCSSKNQIEDQSCRNCDLSRKPRARHREEQPG